MLNTLRTQHSLNVDISGKKQSITLPFSVQIMSYFGASDRQIRKLASPPISRIAGCSYFITCAGGRGMQIPRGTCCHFVNSSIAFGPWELLIALGEDGEVVMFDVSARVCARAENFLLATQLFTTFRF